MTHADALGRRVALARQRAGLSQQELAAASGMDRSALAKIETGTRRVSALELAQISEATDLRIGWFFADEVPAIVSHRDRTGRPIPDSTIDAALERVTHDVEFVRSLGDLETVAPDFVPLRRPTDVDALERDATLLRSALGVHDRQTALLDLSRRASAIGLMSFSLLLGTDAADAASLRLEAGGVAVVNGSGRVGRRRLALAHELGHYVYADEYSVDWRVGDDVDPLTWEARMDRFGRALLLPADGLTTRWSSLSASGKSLRERSVRLASEFRVDMSTLARRLYELDVVGEADAASVRRVRTTKADIVDFDLLVHHELEPPEVPRAFIAAVLDAYRVERINGDRAVELLGGTFEHDDLPALPDLPAEAAWHFV